MWIFLALLSSAIFAAVAVIDKRLIDRYVQSLPSYYVWIGITVLFYGILFLVLAGGPDMDHPWHTMVAALSGVAWGGATAMVFLGYKLQEVTRASAMVFTFPVFVAIFAVLFMGESLVPLPLAPRLGWHCQPPPWPDLS